MAFNWFSNAQMLACRLTALKTLISSPLCMNIFLSMWNVDGTSSFSLGWPCHLLWPIKYSRNKDVPNLSLGPKRPWVLFLTLMDPSLLHKNKAGLVCFIKELHESDKRHPNWGHNRPSSSRLNFLLTADVGVSPAKISQARPRAAGPPTWPIDLWAKKCLII